MSTWVNVLSYFLETSWEYFRKTCNKTLLELVIKQAQSSTQSHTENSLSDNKLITNDDFLGFRLKHFFQWKHNEYKGIFYIVPYSYTTKFPVNCLKEDSYFLRTLTVMQSCVTGTKRKRRLTTNSDSV